MNRLHQWLCASKLWSRAVEQHYLPWALEGAVLGDDVLEIGPGYGATTRVLARGSHALTAIELDAQLATRVRGELGARVRVVVGDGARLPFDAGSFSAVVCFTMLHHVASSALQDQLFREARRVLRPGGVFAGADSLSSLGFRLLHVHDTMNIVDPAALPARLETAGFSAVHVELSRQGAFKFRALAE
ncbi:MAG: class I SAM-dependent methyltransferase [Polyangiales bacterium]